MNLPPSQNDIGGQRSLVNKWTTFLKARMVCVVQEQDGTETHFDELGQYPEIRIGQSQDCLMECEDLQANAGFPVTQKTFALFPESVFLLESEHPKRLLVFAVFTSTSSVFKGSAVCVYNMADILTVFNGPFAHREGPNFQWVAYQGRIPYPRPGMVSLDPGGWGMVRGRGPGGQGARGPGGQGQGARGPGESPFPDDVVTFIRNHPVMFNPIYPMGRKPLVVRTNADYKYTAIAVDEVIAADGRYQQQLYVSSEYGVSQVSLHRCHAYGSACADCCLARDPYCAWDGLSCSRFYPTGKRRSRRQDIIHGNPLTQCRGYNLKAYRNAVETVQYAVKNNTTFLECLPKSPQASVRVEIYRPAVWREELTLEKCTESPNIFLVKPSDRLIPSGNGLLIRSAQPSDQGLYYCQATENGFKRTVAKIRLKVLSDSLVMALTDKQRSPWALASSLHPKALVSAFSPAEALALQQYCKEQRQAERLGPLRGDLAKLKPLLDHRKSRNRRNHLPQG
ncbi:hypothetical protein JZ751_003508 [Albula glossodonta]|uniref:Semaphorin-3C n=1 Tax=Albula glossodonta TaxID=121402 RepID=A0A8T2MPT7_9TELE|nr:hypothetical protein JZ751_003508 [Albula glossodonta]